MTTANSPALELAIAAFRTPILYSRLRDRQLPADLLLLLRVAAGELQAMEHARSLSGESATIVTEAATMFIQQLLFFPGADSYRVLGVDATAGDGQIRENYRWLVRWLHPDRNDDDWVAVYADRVNQAWQSLRTPERRQEYNRGLPGSTGHGPGNAHAGLPLVRHSQYVGEGVRTHNLRWLPKVVFVGLGLCMVSAIALFVVLRSARTGPEEVAIASALTAVQADPSVATYAATPEPVELAPADPVARDPVAVATVPAPFKAVVEYPVARADAGAVAAAAADRGNEPPPGKAEPMRTLVTVATLRGDSPAHPARPVPGATADDAKIAKGGGLLAAPEPAPAAVEAADPPAIARPARPAQDDGAKAQAVGRTDAELDEADRILGNFSQAYADGSLDRMKAIFTADARSSQGGLGAILANYNQLFQNSSDRKLVVHDVSWFTSGETATIIASYHATVIEGRSRRLRRTHGDLRLDLRRENEQWRIFRFLHDEQSG